MILQPINLSGSGTFSLQSGINNLGNLSACRSSNQYFYIDITNTVTLSTYTYTYVMPDATLLFNEYVDSNYSMLTAGNASAVTQIVIDGLTTGSFNVSWVSQQILNTDILSSTGGNSAVFTEYPADGGLVRGSFNLNLMGRSPNYYTYTAQGHFSIQKK